MFLAMVNDLRRHFKGKGCTINSEFRLHVTLGRVKDRRMNLNKLLGTISRVELSPITLTLTEVEYRIFRGKTLGLWTLNS